MSRKLPSNDKWGTKKDAPIVQGLAGLFDEEEMGVDSTILVDRFVVKWRERVHPYSKYERNIEATGGERGRWLRNVKDLYKAFVIEERWPEEKFVMVIDDVLTTTTPLTRKAIGTAGVLYDQGRLELQLKGKRRKRL